MTGSYAVVVITLAFHHELFRDEVRALSIARGSATPAELWANLHNEGHPILWYAILWIAVRIVGSMTVLKPVAAGIAIAAVWLFCRRAPLPRWARALFVFGQLPLYEYAVMCRNYGISMLLLFGVASVYRDRWKRPEGMAVLLALLANTNAHSLLLTAAFSTAMALDAWRCRARLPWPRLLVAAALVGAAMLFSAVTMKPDRASIVTSLDALGVRDVARAVLHALVAPTGFYQPLAGRAVEAVMRALFLGLLVVLLDRPPLALALGLAAVAFAVFPQLIYPTYERHVGLLPVFAIALLWMRAVDDEAPARVPAWLERTRAGLLRAAPVVGALFLGGQVALAAPDVIGDLRGARSSSAALGALLSSSAELHDAVIVGEPDVLLEALPYYAPNPIYQPREHRFLLKVSFTAANQRSLSLDELMAAAAELAARSPRPVLIVLAHRLDAAGPFVLSYSYGKDFTFTPQSRARFLDDTHLLASLRDSSGAENFDVYRWR